jgi:hypothetical protein
LDNDKFDLWVNHPQTQEFFQYLRDYRKAVMERWASGQLSGDDNLMAIARAQQADEIVNLDADAIKEFYNNHKEETNAE